MKTVILAAFVAVILSIGLAYAEPVSHTAPQQDDTQFNWMAGAAGWG
jgi:hypothetical protein